MKGVGWSLSFLTAICFTVILAEESPSDLKNDNNKSVDNNEKAEGRSGAPSDDGDSAEALLSSLTNSEANEQSKTSEDSKGQAGNQQSSSQNGRYQNQNEYGLGPKPSPNLQASNGETTRDGEVLLQHAISRLIPYHQHVFPHHSHGGNNAVVCTREGELHNVWSSNYQCLVCACISYSGLLRPVCASCAGCMAPGPDPYETETPLPPVTFVPPPVTYLPPPEEEVSCRPLPTDQPFENPLHPCQVCVCTESLNAFGKADVRIRCEENPQCVLPPHSDVIHIVPDEPSSLCDEFPLNVQFPHPADACQVCTCSVQLSPYGQPEKVITCTVNPDCSPDYPVTTTPFWPPTTVRPGPLPGPSPHASCRPYVPNQPFEHPWDECQMCVCAEAVADNLVTVEISCFTKKSCCIEPPENLFPVTALPHPYQPHHQDQDSLCQYRPYGVEFSHPSDQCAVCTCEVRGQKIFPYCRLKNVPECALPGNSNPGNPYPGNLYPGNAIGKSFEESSNSESPALGQNSGNNNNFRQFPGAGGSGGQSVGSSQTSGGTSTKKSTRHQKKSKNSQSGSEADTQFAKHFIIGGYPEYNPGQYVYQGQGISQYHHAGPGGDSVQKFRPPGFNAPDFRLSQTQATASASASSSAHQNAYGYAPGYQSGGLAYPGLNNIRNQQLSQSVATAQASAKSSKAPKGRSGNPDDKATSKEN